MTSAMDEVFGHQPNRPEHPDYWKLVSVILGYDAAAREGENVMEGRVSPVIDLPSVRYVARQRAQLTMKFATEREWRPVRALNGAWLDGFLTGLAWTKEDLPDVGETPKSGPRPEELP